MSKQSIRDYYGKIIGYIETNSTTQKQTGRDFYGWIVGYYDPKLNVTRDFYGKIVGKGNLLSYLIANQEIKNAKNYQHHSGLIKDDLEPKIIGCLLESDSGEFINSVDLTIEQIRDLAYKKIFDICDQPRNGICYLNKEGKFLYYKDNKDPSDSTYAPYHGCEVDYLWNEYSIDKNKALDAFWNCCLNLNDGYIREEEHRIDLRNFDNLTTAQYNSLRLWIDDVQSKGYVDELVVMSEKGDNNYVKYNLHEVDSKYIINRIRRLFATGTLLEAKRSELITKGKTGQKYKNSNKNRWDARTDSNIANTTSDYNKIDMNALWKDDKLVFGVKVKGKTDDYLVTVGFNNILQKIHNEISHNKNLFNRDIVTRALIQGINSGDIKVNCTCPDFKYRQAYWASQKGYKAGKEETRKSNKTNPNDSLGGNCKHILAVLNNTFWIRNIGSVICNYANYCKDNMEVNYGRYIFPKLFGMTYKQAIDTVNDTELASDENIINLAISVGKQKGRFLHQAKKEDNKK